ncbi:asparagine synthase (glutamine-hydrolyzing) [Gimesia sp.]|uniref:asparagine synthase (glutamine-hydrolyzing) n=1 Tax=Gimesia sp. TaxID=2024833 RepID=UPI000C3A8649|nr:asparagine synthase (glutamine-hydrolyzing) [Gimesia sp.]MAX39024.1 asparagine synthase (glutamine-hydrolyzing) [Gimesia sp.]HAH47644.1 asparagine synthase (glutamine-hydrolyzing) [Planctomycetaceae bacterium]HBL43484.1 asparagine synthase (glutamine-hydrolyzing) [Planctomycetaceae bacterium]|tara:strand:- start:43704 stop:45542 length:1839 start_codon:yes stop_codon:yes gene_type:complete
MCGIIGGYDCEQRPFGTALAERGCERMRHRGPDDRGLFEADGMLVGNQRLSILDLAGGHQPMFSDDEQIIVVQNGEIYNFRELAKNLNCRTSCDTEVILRLYERDGEEFVKQLNGMFAIAILDRRKQCLLLYRDRIGQKPVYLHDDGTRLLFASEIKSLFAMGVKAEMNWEGFDAYLTYNFVPPPITLFQNITHLMPGHMLKVTRQGSEVRRWWNLAEKPVECRSESAWSEEIIETLRSAVNIRLRADVPLGAFLSGGIDSSSVVSLMSRELPHPVQTFCIGFDDPRFDESHYAQELADLFQTRHTCDIVSPNLTSSWPLTLYHNDQPHGDVSFMPTYRVSQLARKAVKVVLTGDGGDELFAGYDVHRNFFANQDLTLPREQIESAYIKAISLMQPADKRKLYSSSVQQQLAGGDASHFARSHLQEFRHLDPINQALALDTRMLLPGNNLVKPDKMAMAVSLEPRAPYLDYRMVDLAFRIPGSFKLRNGVTKSILKKACTSILPEKVIYRKKQMFTVPIGEWFKRELSPFVNEVLLSERSLERRIFLPERLREMINEHQTEKVNHTRALRALLALELWQRIFIDQVFDHAPNFAELGIHSSVELGTGSSIAA